MPDVFYDAFLRRHRLPSRHDLCVDEIHGVVQCWRFAAKLLGQRKQQREMADARIEFYFDRLVLTAHGSGQQKALPDNLSAGRH
jgi:hypothetical protein